MSTRSNCRRSSPLTVSEDEVYAYLLHLEDVKNKIEGNVNLRLLLLNNFYALEELLSG